LEQRAAAAFSPVVENFATSLFVTVAVCAALVFLCVCIIILRKPRVLQITFDDIEVGPRAPLTPKIALGVPQPQGVPPRNFLRSEPLQQFRQDLEARLTPKVAQGVVPRIFLGSEPLSKFCKEVEAAVLGQVESLQQTPWETGSIALASLGLGSRGVNSQGLGSRIVRGMRIGLPGSINSPVAASGNQLASSSSISVVEERGQSHRNNSVALIMVEQGDNWILESQTLLA
jgi:hypothetical protein